MRITVKYFASIRETIGRGNEVIDTSARSCGELRDELLARGGSYAHALARGRAVRMAVDQVMSGEAAAIAEGCEIAFFPPVTGG